MTPSAFNLRMAEIIENKDVGAVKRDGLKLITEALGQNVPAFMPGLEIYLQRLEAEPARNPKPVMDPIS